MYQCIIIRSRKKRAHPAMWEGLVVVIPPFLNSMFWRNYGEIQVNSDEIPVKFLRDSGEIPAEIRHSVLNNRNPQSHNTPFPHPARQANAPTSHARACPRE